MQMEYSGFWLAFVVLFPVLSHAFFIIGACFVPRVSHLLGVSFSASTTVVCTSQLSAEVLNALAAKIPEMMGGSADLTPSNLTDIKGAKDFQKVNNYVSYCISAVSVSVFRILFRLFFVFSACFDSRISTVGLRDTRFQCSHCH